MRAVDIAAGTEAVAGTAADSQPVPSSAAVDSTKISVLPGVPGNPVFAVEFLRYLLPVEGAHNSSRLPARGSGSRSAANRPVEE